jgi:hypothetical protein
MRKGLTLLFFVCLFAACLIAVLRVTAPASDTTNGNTRADVERDIADYRARGLDYHRPK